MMRKVNTRNKQNLMNDVKKKFHFDPNKDHNSKGRINLKNRHPQQITKGSSCTFSSVKPQNIESNDCNDSSWLSKLVNNINEERAPLSKREQNNCEENIIQKCDKQKKHTQIPVTRNTSLGSIFSIDRKSSNQIKSRKSSIQGIGKKTKRDDSKRMSVNSMQDNIEKNSSILKINECKYKKNSSFSKKQTKQPKKVNTNESIQNYSSIKGCEENEFLLKDEKDINIQGLTNKQVCEVKENVIQVKKQAILPNKMERFGAIKKNKTKNQHFMTLDDLSAVTIKKEQISQKQELRHKYSEKVEEKYRMRDRNKENQQRFLNIKQKYQQNVHKPSQVEMGNRYHRFSGKANYQKYNESSRNYNKNDISFGDSKGNIKKNNFEKQEKVDNLSRYSPLFPQTSDKLVPNRNPYLQMPSIPVEEEGKQNNINNIQDLGFLLDNINKKLSIYIEQNHLQSSQQKIQLNFAELRKNMI